MIDWRDGTLRATAALVLAALPPMTRADVARPASLCEQGQTVQFDCATRGGRRISLCGQPPGSLQYRFGRPGQVELTFPTDRSEGPARFLFASYHRFQTDRVAVRFVNEGVQYELFDDQEGDLRTAGVRVRLAGQADETQIACRDRIVSRLRSLKTLLRCDPDSALQGGTCP